MLERTTYLQGSVYINWTERLLFFPGAMAHRYMVSWESLLFGFYRERGILVPMQLVIVKPIEKTW